MDSERAGWPRSRQLAAVLLGAAALLFLGLGKWQIDRAEEKRQLAAAIESRAEMPPLVLGETPAVSRPAALRSAMANGHFEHDERIFIANRRHNGRNGYHVVTPLRIAGSEHRLLVNQGWIEAAADGQPPAVPIENKRLTVRGTIDYPEPPALVLADADARLQWGRVWPYLTVEDFAEHVDYPLLPMLLLQAPEEGSVFQRDWTRKPPNPDMHIAYAIQWFAFALIALGVTGVLVFRKATHD